jgi:hypothetical protein
MGQQQLLLLVLGIVIVGVAVVSGIELFELNHEKARRDNQVNKMLALATEVQAWKITPTIYGGGKSDDPSDFSQFLLAHIGLASSGGTEDGPIVEIPGSGCYRFFARATELQINALNDDCVIGSWTKGLVITGITVDDLAWVYPDNPPPL